MNAGASLIHRRQRPGRMKDGIALAAELIGLAAKALETLHKLKEISNLPEVEA